MTSLLNEIENVEAPEDVRTALRLAAWGVAEMAGRLSRWDRWYLKPYEAMAGHKFNLTTLPCEINVWGALGRGRGTFSRRVAAMSRAAEWFGAHRIESLRVLGPTSDGVAVSNGDDSWDLLLCEGDSATMGLADGVVDLVLTDPPFHDDVQYDELSLPLRVWAGMPVTELASEAVARLDTLQPTCRYRDALTAVFRECRRILRPGGHLVLSFSNRNPHAWADCLAALQEAGFRASGSAILHSENESDHAKRGRRAGSLNLLMVLEASEDDTLLRVEAATSGDSSGDEYRFLTAVTKYFRRVGTLEGRWEEDLNAELAACIYLAPLARPAIDPDHGLECAPADSALSALEPSHDCASASAVPPNQGFERTALRVAAQT
jgi:SAM-dependent methyltransferase